MPKGLVRFQHSGQFHFVTFSCYARQPYLGGSAAREVFERSLEAMRVRYQFVVAGNPCLKRETWGTRIRVGFRAEVVHEKR